MSRLADRVDALERQAERLREDVAASAATPRTIAGATDIIKVKLAESVGATAPDMAACNVMDWTQHNTTDVNTGTVDVYAWTTGADLLMTNAMAYAVWIHHRNRWEFLSVDGGESFIVLCETDGVIPAATIDGAGVNTPGAGIVYPMEVVSGDLVRMQDGGGDMEIGVLNPMPRKVDKFLGDVIQVNVDVNGQNWIVPDEFGPSILFDTSSFVPIPAATLAGAGAAERNTPGQGAAHLLKIFSNDEVDRAKDQNGADIIVVIYNHTMTEIEGTRQRPAMAHGDAFLEFVVSPPSSAVVLFDTYSGVVPGRVADNEPGKATCRRLTFDGTNTAVDGTETVEVFNVGAFAIPSDAIPRVAVVDSDGDAWAVVTWSPRDACDELANKTPADVDVIPDATDVTYILGVDGSGCWVRVPISSCPVQVAHQ
ncbi:hypothetical protein DRH27_02050 [Candidatus Falkowbacteria bacterium]|nr:MAG: hypothetical protein DRH27_02050 [Candidatus Falkowbacteria bacterium]